MAASKPRMMTLIGIVTAALALALSLMPGAATAQTKTLRIGAVINDTWRGGVDFKKYLDVVVPTLNESGGLMIGGERYNIELIRYDTKANAETGRAAVERLIDRDKVKFILGDESIDSWLSLTEANKIVVIAQTPAPSMYNPKWNYVFEGCGYQTMAPTVWGWLMKNSPNMKTVSIAFPDNAIGHGEHGKVVKLAAKFGQKVLADIYYPPDTNDFSSVAARIKKSNPDFFTCGGDSRLAILFKGFYEGGYRGQIVSYLGASVPDLAKVIPLNMIEGLIAGALDPFQFEPLPAAAQKFKDVYVAKYGTWDYPYVAYWHEWDELIAALKKANSLDADKVAAVLSSGMQFDSVIGPAKMVARPDFKNQRTVSLVGTSYVFKVSAGKPKLMQAMSLEEAYEFNKKFFDW